MTEQNSVKEASTRKDTPQNIPQLTLSDGTTIPQLGCGVWELTGQEAYASVTESIKQGYRLIDTAQYYRNEKETYQAVMDSGLSRNEFYITTKLNPMSGANEKTIREALDKSLDNMGGVIDLELIHWPFSQDETAWKIMEEYVEDGKFISIGLSNYSPDEVRRILKLASVKPVLNQIEIHPYNSKYDKVREYEELGLKAQAWSPLGAGRQGLLKDPVLLDIAKSKNKSSAQIVLRWNLQRGLITIPRSRNIQHIKENISITDFELSKEEMKRIDDLNRNEALWDI